MLLRLASEIERVTGWIGTIAAYLVYPAFLIILYELFVRSVFNQPTAWVHDLSGWLQVFYVFLGGAWALQKGYFVRVDILYQSFPPRLQAFIDLFVTTFLMAVFSYVMIRYGYEFAHRSFLRGEAPMNGAWNAPVWPTKAVMVVGMALLSLAWVAKAIRSGHRLFDPASTETDEGAGPTG